MNLLEFYPTADSLVQNEIETVKFLSTHTDIKTEYAGFAAAATKAQNQFSSGSLGFRFEASLDIFHQEMPGGQRLAKRARPSAPSANTQLIIAALIEQNKDRSFGNISYVLAVCRIHPGKKDKRDPAKNHCSILRKFHFDITASQTRRQPHPMSHLQYCGEMVDIMHNLGYRKEQLVQLHADMREPRIFFWPMSLALVIDMACREFPEPRLSKFRGSSEWRNIVRKDEFMILKPFYEKCVSIVGSSERRRPILSDQFYVS